MDKEYLNFGVGSPLRKCVVKNIEKIPVRVPTEDGDAPADKICLTVEDKNCKQFQISDIWVDKDGEPTIKGLWFTLSDDGQLSPSSSVAKLLNYYHVTTLNGLMGLEIKTFPDKKDFLVIVACDIELSK